MRFEMWMRASSPASVMTTASPSRNGVTPVSSNEPDGFSPAFWKRPHAYLDPLVRAGMSSFAALDDELVARGIAKLAVDLESGRWHERNADLLDLDELDAGHSWRTEGDLPHKSPVPTLPGTTSWRRWARTPSTRDGKRTEAHIGGAPSNRAAVSGHREHLDSDAEAELPSWRFLEERDHAVAEESALLLL